MDKVARDQLVGLQTEALGPETGSDRWESSAQPAERVAEAIHSLSVLWVVPGRIGSPR